MASPKPVTVRILVCKDCGSTMKQRKKDGLGKWFCPANSAHNFRRKVRSCPDSDGRPDKIQKEVKQTWGCAVRKKLE